MDDQPQSDSWQWARLGSTSRTFQHVELSSGGQGGRGSCVSPQPGCQSAVPAETCPHEHCSGLTPQEPMFVGAGVDCVTRSSVSSPPCFRLASGLGLQDYWGQGHMPRLWAPSPVGGVQEAAYQCFSLSLPSSKNNQTLFKIILK